MRSLCIVVAASLLVSTSAVYAAGCVESSDKETWQYRYCPGGVAYERQYIAFGTWRDWKAVHKNFDTPCKWSVEKKEWQCEGQTIRCGTGSCR